VNAKAAGDDEAMFYDEDYVTALERPAADRGSGYRYRPYGDAVYQQPHHPRRDPVPGDASG
jgi:lysyl-tRNA synthetase class 2